MLKTGCLTINYDHFMCAGATPKTTGAPPFFCFLLLPPLPLKLPVPAAVWQRGWQPMRLRVAAPVVGVSAWRAELRCLRGARTSSSSSSTSSGSSSSSGIFHSQLRRVGQEQDGDTKREEKTPALSSDASSSLFSPPAQCSALVAALWRSCARSWSRWRAGAGVHRSRRMLRIKSAAPDARPGASLCTWPSWLLPSDTSRYKSHAESSCTVRFSQQSWKDV